MQPGASFQRAFHAAWARCSACLLVGLCGCAAPLTRANFDSIRPRVDTRAEVEAAIGAPTHNTGDAWLYEDQDRHISAQVFFDEDGVVAGKQWMDTTAGAELISKPGG